MTGQPRSARRVANNAQDRKTGMSLGDVAQFVADAYSAGLTDAAEVRVQIGWRAQVQTATAEGIPGDGIPQQHDQDDRKDEG